MTKENNEWEIWRSAMDTMGVAVLITDADLQPPGPRIIYANQRFCAMTGYDCDELVGASPRLFQGPETDRAVLDRLRDSLAAGEECRGELLSYRKDGNSFNAELTITPVRNAGEEVVRWIFVQRDVTHERRWADEMQRINAILSVQMELSPDGILVVDVEGNVIAYNGRFQEMWGIPLEAFSGGDERDLIRHAREKLENPETLDSKLEAFYRSGEKRFNDEVNLIDGRVFERYCVATRSPEGRFYGWLWYFTDITEQRGFEQRMAEARREAEAANLAKSQFLANMSHEIRTPLNGILGLTEILLQTELTNEQRDFLSSVQTSGDNLLVLVNDLLDLSKIESGRLELDKGAFDLHSLIEDSLAVAGMHRASKDLDMGYTVDSALPERLVSDENRIRQVLINLLGNAVKFTGKGEVVLDVRIRPSGAASEGDDSPDTLTLQFSVRDTGIGIPEEGSDRLFQPFSQVDPSTTRRYGGSGLGLSICHRLVEALGGEIWMESGVGEGTEFFFTVPAEVDTAGARPGLRGPDLTGRTLLVVDDHAVSRSMVRHQAERLGIGVDEASGLDEAFGRLEDGARYDVLVVDLQMPDEAALRRIQQLRDPPGGGERAIILAISRDVHSNFKETIAEYGFFSVFKPFRQFQLNALLSEIFNLEQEPGSAREAVSRFETGKLDGSLRVLLAEDNSVNLKVAVNLLKQLGLEADTVANGRDAVEQWKTGRHDVVLMDVHMPVMDGLEATRELRRISRDPRKPWVVGVTADAMTGDGNRCIRAGMNDYLSKPIRSIDLTAVFRRMPTEEEEKGEPDSGGAAGNPGICEQRLGELKELGGSEGEAFLREIVEIFLADAPGQIAAMRQALERKEGDALANAAHSLKGSSSNFGALRIQEDCRRLESMGRQGALEGAGTVIERIECGFAEIEPWLRKRFPGSVPD